MYGIRICCVVIIVLVGALLAPQSAHAQNQLPTNEVAGREYLADRGITEAEFRAAMSMRGYDLDNIDPDPAILQELQRVSVEVIDSLVAVKEQQVQADVDETLEQATDASVDDISEAIEDGASTEEAIAEELQEIAADDLPEAKVYGHHLFRGRDASVFRQADRIKPPRSYVLGTGDELTVFINGPSQLEATSTVDERGYIRIATFPPVPVRGLSVEAAEEVLMQRFRQYMVFNENQFNVSVLAARTITVNFYGEVNTVGSITLSAVNTLFNALVAAGGPTDIGTVRRIQLIQGDEVKVFDTYEYMQNPQVAQDFYLQDNDYVQIPVATRVVSIAGAVRRPFKYELLDDEHLIDLIEYAGGLKDNAYLNDIQITRYGREERVVININLAEIMDSGGDYLLQPGDEISIRSIEAEVLNYVEIEGAVANAGQYERTEGMRVADLISRGVLLDEARLDFGYVLRYKPDGKYSYMRFIPQEAINNPGSADNFVLQDQDIVRIPSLARYSDQISFAVLGAVRIPGSYGFDPGGVLKVQDAMLISGGLTQGASDVGYIIRRPPDNPKRADYIPFNPKMAMSDPASSDNITLVPYDSVYIFDKESLTDNYFITVGGAVRNPDVYAYDSNLTLAEALTLAGGLRFDAASNRIEIARVIINENESTRIENRIVSIDRDIFNAPADSTLRLMPFDHIYVRQVPDFELQRTVRLQGQVQFPGVYAIVDKNEKLASLIRRAGGLSPEAYSEGATMQRPLNGVGSVVIDLARAIDDPNSNANLVLMDGDVIDIPRRQDLVTIQGAVNLRDFYPEEFLRRGNRISVTHQKSKNAKYYIDEYAAGLAEDGRKRLITVVHPNGKVEKTTSILFFKSYPKVPPGAVVNVGKVAPEEPTEPAEQSEVDWGAVVRDTLAQAVAIITLIVLIDRL